MTDKEYKRMLQLYRCMQYEQTSNRIDIAAGLIECQKLDEKAAEELRAIGITPAIYYKTRPEITTRGDRIAAAKYYSQYVEDISIYSMHHTADGLYIIPVLTEIHENTRHVGGSHKIHKAQFAALFEQYQQQQQQQQTTDEDAILEMFDI